MRTKKTYTQEELDLQIRDIADKWDNQPYKLPFDKESLWTKIASQKGATPVGFRMTKYAIAASIAILLGVGWGAGGFISDSQEKTLAQNARIIELEQTLEQQKNALALQPKEVIVYDTIVQTKIIEISRPAVANAKYEEQLKVYEESIAMLRAQNVELSASMRRRIDCLCDSIQQQSDYITQLQGQSLEQSIVNGPMLANSTNVQINQINSSPSASLNKRAGVGVQIFAKRTAQKNSNTRSLISREIKL